MKSRTNLCTCPSFEAGITGWVGNGGATVAQSSAWAQSGSKSLLITWPAQPGGGSITTNAAYSLATVVGQRYRVSLAASGTPSVSLAVCGKGPADVLASSAGSSPSLTFTATASSHLVAVWTSAVTTAGQFCNVDAVLCEPIDLIEPADQPATFFDGDTAGCVWNGVPGLSTSTYTPPPTPIFDTRVHPGTVSGGFRCQ